MCVLAYNSSRYFNVVMDNIDLFSIDIAVAKQHGKRHQRQVPFAHPEGLIVTTGSTGGGLFPLELRIGLVWLDEL